MSTEPSDGRSLDLRRLDAASQYLHRVTPDSTRTGLEIQRVTDGGFYAEVDVDATTKTFLLAFTERAARELEQTYDQIVTQLDLNAFDHEK